MKIKEAFLQELKYEDLQIGFTYGVFLFGVVSAAYVFFFGTLTAGKCLLGIGFTLIGEYLGRVYVRYKGRKISWP
tara:strand:+ start:193 stop:417 length:225 start_codon:yes stop_codon:yes gene_type:complete